MSEYLLSSVLRVLEEHVNRNHAPKPDNVLLTDAYLQMWPDGSGRIVYTWVGSHPTDLQKRFTNLVMQPKRMTEISFDNTAELAEILRVPPAPEIPSPPVDGR